MGTKKHANGISAALFGTTRRSVLGLLFLHPERTYYLREIVRTADVGQGAAQRELRNLTVAGIISRERRGNQVHYRANRQCPVFEELRSLMVKTAGLADVLREALAPLADGVQIAFVHGSAASGEMGAQNDVDLIMVGEVGFADVVTALQDAQEELAREVNPTVYRPAEFREKIAADHHFLSRVMAGPKVLLIGDESALRAVGT